MLVSEHIYTCAGWQRPVLLAPATREVRFAGEGLAEIQISYDAVEDIRCGRAEWLAHEGGTQAGFGGGSAVGIGGLRVRVDDRAGGKLVVVQVRANDNDKGAA